MSATTQRTARTPDGRTLAIEEAGDPGGRPVLVHNGTPNSRHLWPAARIPGVEARLLDDDGHLTLETKRIGELHGWLAERI
jgi:hypothetical protein